MPTYILTLLKNPASDLDEYYSWNIHQTLVDAVFLITNHHLYHCTIAAQAID